jgi:hypothetical protein
MVAFPETWRQVCQVAPEGGFWGFFSTPVIHHFFTPPQRTSFSSIDIRDANLFDTKK